jgi:SAM-dependent methyltransferase
VTTPVLEILRCPVCGEPLTASDGELACAGCGARYAVEDGIPRMLDDRLPGIAEKRAEIAGWVEKASQEGWYRSDDAVDRVLPYVCRDLGWDDPIWRANEYSFERLLDHYVQPGDRLLEVGAAKCWAAAHLLPRGCEYVGTDILTDSYIGLGRGAFYAERVGDFPRVQADAEHLPFADESFDVTFCVATLHHALDLRAMVAEMGRVTRRGGVVAALNEGTRGLRSSADAPGQRGERELGINEHVHTVWAYLGAFARAGLVVRRLIPADGDFSRAARSRAGRLLLRLPRGESLATIALHSFREYGGISLFASRGVRGRKRP